MTDHENIRRNQPARLLVVLAAAICSSAAAQSADDLPLFNDTATLKLRLEAPLRTLRRDARTRPEHDSVIRYTDPSGSEIVLDVEVRVRGNSRLAECSFPPLRLDFRRGQLEGTVFAGQNRLKLVTLCKSTDRYRDYLHLEYDVYRLFNALTDYSFRVRRVDVEYVSTDSRREEVFTEPAFLIEEEWEVAARHGAQVVERQTIDLNALDPGHTGLLAAFHYIIGNTDWSALRGQPGEDCCHNGKALETGNGRVIVVPYDFDQSGLINTDYARPNAILPIRTVRQRLYRGYCAANAGLDRAVEQIMARRGTLEQVLASSEASEGAKADALDYLRESIDILEDPARRAAEIDSACR